MTRGIEESEQKLKPRSRRSARKQFCKSIKKRMNQYLEQNLNANNKHENHLYTKLVDYYKSDIRRQYRVGFFFIDLLMVDRLLAIEVDGDSHNVLSQIVKDRKKEALIKKLGFSLVRIRNEDVYNWDLIHGIIENYPSHPKNAEVFKTINRRVTGYIGYLVKRMSHSSNIYDQYSTPHCKPADQRQH